MKHLKSCKKIAKALTAFSVFSLLAAPMTAGVLPNPVGEAAAIGTRWIIQGDQYIDYSIRPLELAINSYGARDGDQLGELLRSRWTRVNAIEQTNDDTPIGVALRTYSENEERAFRYMRERLTREARKFREERRRDGGDLDSPFVNTKDVFYRRSDTLAVSFLEKSYLYMGGVHGEPQMMGWNFDTQTGKLLTLDDVFTDRNELAGAIAAQLREDYPAASFMESGGVGMMEIVEKMAREGSLIWTLDPSGASFYFNPYILGSYGEGIFTVTVLFAERPDIFREEYRRAPNGYSMELCPWLPVRAAFANGSGGSVLVRPKEFSDGGDCLEITCGGRALTEPGHVDADVRPVLVDHASGRQYLYVDVSEDGKNYETRVYNLSDAAPVRVPMGERLTRKAPSASELDKSFYILNDAENFLMYSLDAPENPLPLRRCRVGENGAPEVTWAMGIG